MNKHLTVLIFQNNNIDKFISKMANIDKVISKMIKIGKVKIILILDKNIVKYKKIILKSKIIFYNQKQG